MSDKCIRPEGAVESNRDEEFGLSLRDESHPYIGTEGVALGYDDQRLSGEFQFKARGLARFSVRTISSVFRRALLLGLAARLDRREELPQLGKRFGQDLA